ncbi:DUF6221 family protein [Streptomyces africanus]|uniref:DUF6221 family protein n=1 Tax=Streptomyces africanus TaxID=231024 RepID=UPI000A38D4C5|nr:DUF6221 family protein [Streptomyces africanus]
MEDLVQWLSAQLNDDERIAREATPGPWAQSGIGEYGWGVSFGRNGAGVEADDSDQGRADAEHIAEHNPARVLREIEAKRQLIARGGPFCTSDCDEPGNEPMDPDTNWATPLEHHLDCDAYTAAAVLALPYADRPGYKENWRP